jgi:nicotinate (nicotinamide) nucleotide adenylyltransferase
MPAADPPPTAHVRKKPWLSFEFRLALCKAMVGEIGASSIEVSALEASLPAPNYTLNTVEALIGTDILTVNGNTTRLAVTIGADQFQALDSWYRLDRLVELADFIIIPRGSDPVKWPPGDTARRARFWSLNAKTPQVSSTLIRETIEHGQALPKDWLPESVLSRLQELTGKAIQVADRKGTNS